MPTSTRGEWRALARRRRYPSFVVTVSVSRIVSAMFLTASVVLVLDRTGSAPLAGAVTAAATLPGALAGPWLGAWLDVAGRRRPLIAVDLCTTAVAVVGLVTLAGHGPNWTLVPVGALVGITSPLSTGSFASALSELAGPELLDRASALEATSMNLGIVVGPALAGGLIGLVGAGRVLELQAALSVLVALAVAVNPGFEARGPERVESVAHAVRDGTRALLSHRLLRDTLFSSQLANFSWGLMMITFPLWAAGSLGTGRGAAGYLWAALAFGSIVGTFALHGGPSRARVGASYVALALSGLVWLLARSLLAAIGLVGLSGVLEGPAYSGTIALRQRHAPARVRAQVLNTMQSFNRVAASAGSLLAGLMHRPSAAFVAFCAANLLAALIMAPPRGTTSRRRRPMTRVREKT